MIIEFTEHGWEDFAYWLENDPAVAIRIKELLKDITRTPFKGMGKPEPLKHALKGFWSTVYTQVITIFWTTFHVFFVPASLSIRLFQIVQAPA
jgi:Txe/YoeB family toxin of toxin-antitoxin system